MYAVIQTGGKQYRVRKGDTVQVELLPLDLAAKIDFKDILLVGEGAEVKVGQPVVASASVSAEVVAIEKGPKIIPYHKKRRKQFDRKIGHRQPYTRLLITMIDNGSGAKETLSAEERKQIMGRVGFAQADAYAEAPVAEKPAKEASGSKLGLAKKAISASKKPAKKTAAKKPAKKK